MEKRFRSRIALAAFLFLSVVLTLVPENGTGAFGRSFAVDDLLKLEGLGQTRIDQRDRRLVFERITPYESAPWFGYGYFVRNALSRLYSIDLSEPGAAEPLFSQDARTGYWMGDFSPDGDRLAVFWLDSAGTRAGVFDLSSEELTEFPFTPDALWTGPSQVWLDSETLIYAAVPPGYLPYIFRFATETPASMPRQWFKAWSGKESTASALGSGRHLGIRDKPPLGRLVLASAKTGEVINLVAGNFVDIELSPTRRMLAAVRRTIDVSPDPQRLIRPAFMAQRNELVVIDIGGDVTSAQICPQCDVLYNLLAWSPSGEKLLFFARSKADSWEQGQFYQYSVASQSVVDVASESVKPTIGGRPNSGSLVVRADWLGETPIVFGYPRSTDPGTSADEAHRRPDWFAVVSDDTVVNLTEEFDSAPTRLLAVAERAMFIVADGDVWRIEVDGDRQNLTSEIETPLTAVEVSYAGWSVRGVRFRYNNPPRSHHVALQTAEGPPRLVLLDLYTGSVEWVEKPSQHARPLAVSVANKMAIYRNDEKDGVGRVVGYGPERGPTFLTEINEHLAEVERGPLVRIDHTGSGGQELTSWLLLPPNAQPGERHPLIVQIYPGRVLTPDWSGPNHWEFRPSTSPHLIAAQGYGVLIPSIPLQPAPSDPMVGLADAILRAVDRAIELGYADPNRLGLHGHSFGGQGALAVASQTDRFKAIVSAAPLSNLTSAYGTMDPRLKSSLTRGYRWTLPVGWAETGQGRMGAAPWQDPTRYLRNSPLFQADKINTPTLLIQGDLDYVPIGQGEEMFTALLRQRKDAIFVRYWGEGHVLASPANIRDMWTRTFDWYRRHLDESAPPKLTSDRQTPVER